MRSNLVEDLVVALVGMLSVPLARWSIFTGDLVLRMPLETSQIKWSFLWRRTTNLRLPSIPYLAGNNNNEASYYRESALSQNKTLAELLNEEGFTCATAHAVSARAIARAPSWRYIRERASR